MFEKYRIHKNMTEVESQTWTKIAEIETEDFTVEGIYNAICSYFGEEFFELDSIDNCIKEGWIELCDDGFIVWADLA